MPNAGIGSGFWCTMPHLYIIQYETSGKCESRLYVCDTSTIFENATMITTDEYGRKVHKCSKCGTVAKKGRKCLVCHKKRRTSTQCPHCGQPKCNVSNACKKCSLQMQKGMAKPRTSRLCPDCGVAQVSPKARRCLACEKARRKKDGHFVHSCPRTVEMREAQRKKYWEMRQQPAPDRDVIAAAKSSRQQKKCPKCGVKITTRECVACAVLHQVGEKGFR